MAAFASVFLAYSALLVSPVLAAGQALLVGYGFSPYDPLCAESCLRSLTSYMLSCTPMSNGHGDSHMSATPPECYAEDTWFLTSVAWCLSDKCAGHDVPISKLQLFWEQSVTGSSKVAPKWPYSVALANVTPKPPTYQLTEADTDLNQTSLVSPDSYLAQWNVLGNVAREGLVESDYSLTIIVTSLGLPIVLTLIGHFPFLSRLIRSVKPYLVYPSLVGTYQVRALPFLLGNAPTVGQSIYIAIFVALNVILSAVGYRSSQPNAWFATQWNEISAYVLYRTGTLGFMLLPIMFLFSSRNNALLWLSNWSHSTFLLLHRWVARVFALYVVVHSIIGLQIYPDDSDTTWWIWGAVATMATVVSVLFSGLYVRKSQYELFLIFHILLAVFVVAGCWYHVTLWYGAMGIAWPDTSWGYELWVYLGIAVWFFDRLLRVGRVLQSGILRSEITDLGQGYIRVDIPGVRWGSKPGKHAYVYFPTLDPLRPWENHPFSVIPGHMLRKPGSSERTPSPSQAPHEDEEKHLAVSQAKTVSIHHAKNSAGITLLIKKESGITSYLKTHGGMLTLLDGPYANNNAEDILRCDRVLLVAGGIGITGVLPWAQSHWNVKLAWSVAESARPLVEAVELGGLANLTKEVRVGSRFDVYALIAEEADAGWHRVGVVVSGPGGLCDDVRAAVVAAGRKGKTAFELEVDAYSW
ncbi:ferric reductase-like transmembrane component [Lasiosphaeria miniovina]|uniref:Ferric reductase-like transmembrane component n=1 Tax=Lasiosphaeria miniovina TaxID=1954250 RepID=A0AA40AWK6_9PEZI|nr:ferric reductase-like transmembrane component [Lasiosphaeria miniovina]KAK0723355.1 ferric reductase-like transmembrane component [Lasiosphaeria miniovina]